ncbi:MAG: hypothetical protein K2Y23_19555 [Cyanobacteria bacterium]|nr:hypothetical protein [Cyanobacteriota bacterium]
MSWGDKLPVDAIWKSNNEIAISTIDRVEKFDVQDSKAACGSIKVNYHFQFRNEQQRTEDEAVLTKMHAALADVAPCLDQLTRASVPAAVRWVTSTARSRG